MGPLMLIVIELKPAGSLTPKKAALFPPGNTNDADPCETPFKNVVMVTISVGFPE